MTAAGKPAAATKTRAAKKTTKTATPKKPAAKSRESKTSKRKLVAVDRSIEAMQLRRAGYAVLSSDMAVKFVDVGSKVGNVELYYRFEQYLEEHQSKLVLGQTLTSGSG